LQFSHLAEQGFYFFSYAHSRSIITDCKGNKNIAFMQISKIKVSFSSPFIFFMMRLISEEK
jgi:hypothetical protein